MTGSISRKLYQQFLLLHPKPFRHEFGDEMLGIFEQCKAEQGSWRLFVDVVLSAAKQRIQHLSTPVPRSASFFSEIDFSPNLARILGVVACGAALIASILVGRKPEASEYWTVVRPAALFWFPIIPEGRYCSGTPEHTGEPRRIFTTGVMVTGNAEAPEYWSVVRSKTRFWISTVPWGQYCLDTPERTERSGSGLQSYRGKIVPQRQDVRVNQRASLHT